MAFSGKKSSQDTGQDTGPPSQLLSQAEAAAAAGNVEADHVPRRQDAQGGGAGQQGGYDQFPDIGHVPPPPYDGKDYGQLNFSQMGLDTGAKVGRDGRVNININRRNRILTNLLTPALRNQLDIHKRRLSPEPPVFIPPGLGADWAKLPPHP